MQIEVTMFMWKCSQGHIRNEVQIGIDSDGDMWISFICETCQEEIMQAVRVEDMKAHAVCTGLTKRDMNFLKALRISMEDYERPMDTP